MEINLKPDCQYQFEGCNKVALGVFRNKWTCGKCLLKFEARIKQERSKYFDLVEEEIRHDHREDN